MTKKYTLIFHWWKDGREEEIYNVTEKGDPKGKGIKADCQTYNENMTDDRRADGYYKVRES